MGESKKKEPQYREFEEVTARSVSLKEALNYKHNSCVSIRNEIYYCILSMSALISVVMKRV